MNDAVVVVVVFVFYFFSVGLYGCWYCHSYDDGRLNVSVVDCSVFDSALTFVFVFLDCLRPSVVSLQVNPGHFGDKRRILYDLFLDNVFRGLINFIIPFK